MIAALEKRKTCIATCMRFILGWHLAYLGVWAITSAWTYSWIGYFRCSRWIFSDCFRAIAETGCMNVIDFCFAWGLLAAGILLMLGKCVRYAASFGIVYLALMYILNPPHFGHTGESHFMFIDRNIIEIFMLFCVMFWRKEEKEA